MQVAGHHPLLGYINETAIKGQCCFYYKMQMVPTFMHLNICDEKLKLSVDLVQQHL